MPPRHRSGTCGKPGALGPEIPRAADLYIDDLSTVHAPHFARRNVVLLGDAAHGGTLGGQGTAVGMIGAYLLAGELVRSPRDQATALARYEQRLRPYAMRCQTGAKHVGGFFAPRTRPGLWLRDAMYRALTSRPLAGLFERLWACPDSVDTGITPHSSVA